MPAIGKIKEKVVEEIFYAYTLAFQLTLMEWGSVE